MIDVVPARVSMAQELQLQSAQQVLGQHADVEILEHAIANGVAMAVIDGGRILAIGGVMKVWDDRGNAWGLLADNIGYAFPTIHRVVKRVLDTSPYQRIEAQVAVGHEAGQRWVRLLGLEHEGRMRAFFRGHDYDLFARVK